MNLGIGKVKIGDNVYSLAALAPIEALRFGTECAKVLGPALVQFLSRYSGEEMTLKDLLTQIGPALESLDPDRLLTLLNTVYTHTFTPTNENLGDEAVFNSWFQEHPADMFQVGFQVLYALAKDFFPRLSGTLQQ